MFERRRGASPSAPIRHAVAVPLTLLVLLPGCAREPTDAGATKDRGAAAESTDERLRSSRHPKLLEARRIYDEFSPADGGEPFERGLVLIDEAEAEEGPSLTSVITRGKLLHHLGRWDAIIALLEPHMDGWAKGNREALWLIGAARAKRGEFDAAERYLQRSSAGLVEKKQRGRSRHFSCPFQALGEMYSLQGRDDDALSMYKAAAYISADQDIPNVHAAYLSFLKGDLADAVVFSTRAARLDPPSAPIRDWFVVRFLAEPTAALDDTALLPGEYAALLSRVVPDLPPDHPEAEARRLTDMWYPDVVREMSTWRDMLRYAASDDAARMHRVVSDHDGDEETLSSQTRSAVAAALAEPAPTTPTTRAIELILREEYAVADAYATIGRSLAPPDRWAFLDAVLHLMRNHPDLAAAVCADMEDDPDRTLTAVCMGHVALVRKDAERAGRRFAEAWDAIRWPESEPGADDAASVLPPGVDPRAWLVARMAALGRAWWHANQGEHDAALAYFERIVARAPGDTLALVGLANTLTALGRHGEASEAIDAVLAVNPEHPYALAERGLIALNQGRVDEAEAAFEKALEARPTGYTCPHEGLGLVYLKQGRIEEAKASFETAIETNPDIEYKKYNELARIYIREKKYGKARALLEKSMANYPDDDEAAEILATIPDEVTDAAP